MGRADGGYEGAAGEGEVEVRMVLRQASIKQTCFTVFRLALVRQGGWALGELSIARGRLNSQWGAMRCKLWRNVTRRRTCAERSRSSPCA